MKFLSLLAAAALSFAAVLFWSGLDDVAANSTHQPPAAIPQRQSLYLIRSTLLALDSANRSGNYSVLRDLATPDFQRRNHPDDLATIFAGLRHGHTDLSPAALLTPVLTWPPVPDQNRNLRLAGRFMPPGQIIAFDLIFQIVEGHWRAAAISIDTQPQRQAVLPNRPPSHQ